MTTTCEIGELGLLAREEPATPFPNIGCGEPFAPPQAPSNTETASAPAQVVKGERFIVDRPFRIETPRGLRMVARRIETKRLSARPPSAFLASGGFATSNDRYMDFLRGSLFADADGLAARLERE
jgi:hypothetical protein